jgi:hypothetical protein
MPSIPKSNRRKPPEILRQYLAVDKPNEDGEWAMHCPFHNDEDPSAYVNFEKGVWVCHRGCGHGPISNLIERLDSPESGASITDIESVRKKNDDNNPTPMVGREVVEGWHNRLLQRENAEILSYFMDIRGLTLETIRKFKIGWQPARKSYTIPVFDKDGEVVNIRYYYPKATGKLPKYRNHKGYGRMALYPLWPQSALDGLGLVMCEGELDALILIQNGIPAITVTAGAGNWNSAWNGLFKEKQVWVVYDRDRAGTGGSIRVVNHLRKYVSKIHIVELPFEYRVNHGEDVTDFFVKHGLSIEEFRRILKDSEPASVDPKPIQGEPKPVTVVGSFASNIVGQPLEMRGTVVGHSTQPHLVPQIIKYGCTLDAGDRCNKCPMMVNGGEMTGEVVPENTFILEFLNVHNDRKDALVRELMGIVKCNRMEYTVADNHSVETLVVRSSIDHSAEEAADHTQRRVIAVGPHDTKISETIRLIGTTAPGPKDQVNEFQAWEVGRDRSAFDAFRMTPDIGKSLEVFRPTPGQTPLHKLREIADDLSENVTDIYGRPQLHIAVDLVYHSVTMFRFGGKLVDRGWLDVLVVGDTRTGKSETAAKLRAFYGLGEMLSCESVSFAGVMGGLTQKFGRDWTIVWGALPVNDRRMVILDEVAGLSTDEIAQLSAVRSSGIAKIQKIESQEALARTRLLWLANPRNGKTLSQHTFGIRAIQPLVGNPEDIARFDFALAVSSDDVQFSDINRVTTARGFNISPEAYRNLILWAWSRKTDDVIIGSDTVEEVMDIAGRLPKMFNEQPPLIQGANVRMKIIRIATAMASRLFSTDPSYEKVVVLPEHARAAANFVHQLYSHHNFGYSSESQRARESLQSADKQRASTKIFINSTKSLTKFLRDVPSASFNRQQLEEFLNCSREHANGIIQNLADRDMVKPGDQGQVVMQPVLLEILREM